VDDGGDGGLCGDNGRDPQLHGVDGGWYVRPARVLGHVLSALGRAEWRGGSGGIAAPSPSTTSVALAVEQWNTGNGTPSMEHWHTFMETLEAGSVGVSSARLLLLPSFVLLFRSFRQAMGGGTAVYYVCDNLLVCRSMLVIPREGTGSGRGHTRAALPRSDAVPFPNRPSLLSRHPADPARHSQ